MQKVDETINAICDWIQKDLKMEGFDKGTAEMIKALAALEDSRTKEKRIKVEQLEAVDLRENLYAEGKMRTKSSKIKILSSVLISCVWLLIVYFHIANIHRSHT